MIGVNFLTLHELGTDGEFSNNRPPIFALLDKLLNLFVVLDFVISHLLIRETLLRYSNLFVGFK
jgi:hypothetical protein